MRDKLEPFIEKRWLEFLLPFFETNVIFPYLTERKKHIQIVPKQYDMFNAFKYTPFDKVRVVILGQSPYHSLINRLPEADGLAFSYTKREESDLYTPKSLAIIRDEVEKDVYDGMLLNFDNNLKRWAEQGVFLFNTALTTEVMSKDAHIKLWRPFTEYVIRIISDYNAGVIFCLWGDFAKEFKPIIDETKHYIFEAGHPATELYNGYGNGTFLGCKHFSKINKVLYDNNKEKIEW